ncbi:hypothetical protein HaLaN_32493 [Haematococcus lacustris]|uniref:Uncharacterized protein n=1 Tax=Haematococcus lacustris TaxID=44745 RepID=A0A6A0AN12_HAELA|nr:hypothetical protein HaLaN_32493 [Haematococcus lacustris]
MDLTSAPLRSPALRLDANLMYTSTRPLRLDNVTKSLRCPRKGTASAPSPPHPPQPALPKLTDDATQCAPRDIATPCIKSCRACAVLSQRRQVIKAALRGLVEAALPDLSPAEVDAVVAEVNKRMTMGSKQCVLAAALCLSVLLTSFLGQPTPGFPAAGLAPGPPPPPDPAYPPCHTHPPPLLTGGACGLAASRACRVLRPA